MNKDLKQRLLPFIITPVILILDQITKIAVMNTIEPHGVGFSLFDGFFRIIHERNLGIALSMGDTLPYWARLIFFSLIPLSVLGYAVVFALNTDALTTLQRIALAGIVGGGAGNIIDRIFRLDGVVDFISFRTYGILGFSYFPTFNIADTSLSISAGIFILSLLLVRKKKIANIE